MTEAQLNKWIVAKEDGSRLLRVYRFPPTFYKKEQIVALMRDRNIFSEEAPDDRLYKLWKKTRANSHSVGHYKVMKLREFRRLTQ